MISSGMLRALLTLVLLVGLLTPANAVAGGVSVEEDVFSAPDGRFNLCWLPPSRSSKRDLARLEKALEIAARNTQPGHVDGRLIRIRSRRRDAPKKNCRAVLDVTAKGPRKARRFVFDIYELGEETPLKTETVGPVHAGRVEAAPFEAAFQKLWKAVSPPPPAPPKPEPPVASFVDNEIATERVRLAPPQPKSESTTSRPVVSIGFVSGLFVRSIDDRLGAPQNGARLLSIGGEAALHVAALLGVSNHDVDLDAAYGRQLASAQRGGVEYAVASDRFDIGATYRYHLPDPYLPRIGVRGGFQRLRFEVADEAGALSVRYGAIRSGLVAAQPLVVTDTLELFFDLDGGLRWSPGTETVASLGWDAGADVRLALPIGAYVKLGARVIEQRGTDDAFRDRFIDVDATVGWSL